MSMIAAAAIQLAKHTAKEQLKQELGARSSSERGRTCQERSREPSTLLEDHRAITAEGDERSRGRGQAHRNRRREG